MSAGRFLRPLYRNTPTVAPVPNRSVISLVGSQAPIFLQGVLSAAIHEPPKPQYAAFLQAQGRVLYDVFVYSRQDPSGRPAYLIDYDARPSEAKNLLDTLTRYVLRAKVKIRDVSDQYDVWAAWGSESEQKWETPRTWSFSKSGSGACEPAWSIAKDAKEGLEAWPWGFQHETLHDRRAPGMGERMLVRKGDRPTQASTHDLATADDYTLHRILHGVPEGMKEISPMNAFPMDSNMDVMGGVDFRKGCYVGQELTVRTYHTGMIRKRILPFVVHKPSQTPEELVKPDPAMPSFPSDLDIRALVKPNPERSGATPRPRGTNKLLVSTQGVGLGLMRLEHLSGAQRGDLDLQFEHGGDTWSITNWIPEWWPTVDEAV